MIYALRDLNTRRSRRIRTNFTLFFVIVFHIEGGAIRVGQVHIRNLQIVVVLSRRMCSQKQAMPCESLIGKNFLVGHPLHSESGPLQSMRDHHIIQERRIFLPDFY